MMKFTEEALQEMKEIEESKVTQRFNKCCCLKDWRNKRRYSTLQLRNWQEGTRDPEGHQRATLMVKKKPRPQDWIWDHGDNAVIWTDLEL